MVDMGNKPLLIAHTSAHTGIYQSLVPMHSALLINNTGGSFQIIKFGAMCLPPNLSGPFRCLVYWDGISGLPNCAMHASHGTHPLGSNQGSPGTEQGEPDP